MRWDYLDWEDVWCGVLVLLVLGAGVFAGVFAFMPKNVDYYYLSIAGSDHVATCVDAHWTWHADEAAFCSNDYRQALELVKAANESLPRR